MGLFTSENKTNIKKLKKIADKVVALEPKYLNMSNDELSDQTQILKAELANGKTLNDILPDAYAVMREAAARVLNMRHFYVQILGGIALHQGRIAEMATGEGKTLVATLPAYLNALSGNGVHVVTVNEYLAKRDAEWMGKVYKFLGLTVGNSLTGMDERQKREAYLCDITYCTNNELGFDYLRDNMVIRKEQRVGRGYNFAIVDEVDSILIDEARTPLIISGRGMKSSEEYMVAQKFAKTLKKEEDFEIDLKTKQINLTEKGNEKAEKYFKLDNLADVTNIELNHHIMNALKANFIMIRDENYIVKDDEVIIVDDFTGRLMPGRRYSDGLHQAIEAKEGVKVNDENKTLATVTFQNFFRLYKKLSGMTGTAKTEEAEFQGIYKLDVVTIPTNLPNMRVDDQDVIYSNVKGKYKAIIAEIERQHESGRPILIGTITIDRSEEISKALKASKIAHTVLNAKNHEQESEIVAQAGRLGAVTIATNMAGRGTDILLGGNPEFMAKKKMKQEGFEDEQITYATSFITSEDPELEKARKTYQKYYAEFKKVTDAEKEKVLLAGGLHIIGTERHESRRIDNQLRGRAARQGDPGSSIFFLSMEDDLVRRFSGEKMQKITNFFKLDEDTPFQLKVLTKGVENAQKRIEEQNYSMRKSVLEYDDVMNIQREEIYGDRNRVLDGIDIHEQIMDMYPDVVYNVVYSNIDSDKAYFDWDLEKLNTALENGLFPHGTNLVTPEFVEDLEARELAEKILQFVLERYMEKTEELRNLGLDSSDFERYIMLRVVDSFWTDHIDAMSMLRNEIGLRGYGQHNPVIEYKREAGEAYDIMMEQIQKHVCMVLLNTNIQIEGPKQPQPKYIPVTPIQKTVTNSKKKVGRNDSCPCGSGKKYKNCCGQ